MEIRYIDNTVSTNDYLMDYACTKEGQAWQGAVAADYQSAGKGMGTNTWESETGKNLLFSILVHPDWLSPSMQYLVSMAHACALRDVLSQYTDGIMIKWPNDIYWKDKKLSGTRIDGNIKGGSMGDLVIGTGININQREFHSDAPNPISLYQITGKEHDRREILKQIVERFEHYYDIAKDEWVSEWECDTIMEEYHRSLYRMDGKMYEFEDCYGRFKARIYDVHPNGLMQLIRENGELSQYEFKEVKFII